MKNLFKILALVLAVGVVFSACKPKVDPDPVNQVEDGIYVSGDATADTALNINALMSTTRNEVTQETRSSLYELYIALDGSKGFNIVIVDGGESTTYGPGADFALVDAADLDNEEPQAGLWRGSYEETNTQFQVADDGLYHVIIDTELGIAAIAKVEWGVIGGATPNGWSGSTELTEGAFDLEAIKFETTGMILVVDQFKFRYSNGWKIILDTVLALGDGKKGVKVNTNFGTDVDALVPGGDNIENTVNGVYTVTMDWVYGTGMTASLTKTGNYTPPTYPDSLFIVGDATAYGWTTPGDASTKLTASFHKAADAASNDGIFWKICYLDNAGAFKISAADWSTPNIGFGDVDEFDVNGVTVSDNSGNMSVATSGMYMVVVDLSDSEIKVSVAPATVYGIGDAFGSWDEEVPANLFTVDNVLKMLTSPALVADSDIRMYAAHDWIAAWWNAEFNLYTTDIEYRNDGGEQTAVPGTTGQVISLGFDDNTGAIN